jgi:hypothetical protein
MPEEISAPPKSRRGTIILLTVFAILVICIFIIGLSDAPGYIIAYLATSVLFFTFIRKWRKIKNFIILFAVTLFCIFFLSFMYVEVIYRLAEWIGGITALNSTPMAIITMVITYVILFGGPVGMFAGIAGTVTLGVFRLVSLKKRRNLAHST